MINFGLVQSMAANVVWTVAESENNESVMCTGWLILGYISSHPRTSCIIIASIWEAGDIGEKNSG